MACRIEEIKTICRFCLGQEGLVALSNTASIFSADDVKRCIGVEICPGIPYAICNTCCKMIMNWATFRQSCLRNDIIIRKLAALLNGSVNGETKRNETIVAVTSTAINSTSEHYTGTNSSEDITTSNNPIITLDESNSDYSLPSLYGEAMQEGLNDNMASQSNVQGIKISPGKTSPCSSNEEKTDNLANSTDFGLISTDSNDSDYSLPSLYEESMKALKEHKEKENAAGSVETPTVEREHVCPLCGILSRDIYNHINRTHKKIKKFACKHCQKKFESRFVLKKHINTWHEKHIILTCEHCGRGFTNHSSHFYHIKNSHGESDVYQCETCPSKFKSIDGYRKHLKIHSLTSYPCPECGKLFKTPLTLEKHQLRYHAAN